MRQNEDVIALYSRKSKFTGKGESIGNQVELGKEYVRVHFGDAAVDKIVVYEDEGFSGGNLNRPAFKRMMDAAKKRQFKAIIVYRLDRISRNVSDFSGLIEELARLDISFISIKEQFDTSTPMGRAMMYIASVFSQLERETIAERIRDNMHELAKTGRWLGGTTPTGFESEAIKSVTVDGKTKKACKLKLVPEEADMVKTIFDLYVETDSLTLTEAALIKQGFKTKKGNYFTRFSVKAILQNPVYMVADEEAYDFFIKNDTDLFSEHDAFDGVHGMMAYNRTDQEKGRASISLPPSEWIVSVGKHPGLIPGKVWVQVQESLERNKSKSFRKPRSNEALLTGLLFCSCGERMYPKMSKRKTADGKVIYTYVCKMKERSQRTVCNSKNANGNTLDMAIIEQVKMLADDKETFVSQLEQSRKFYTGNRMDYEQRLSDMKKEKAETEKKINSLVDSLVEMGDSPAKTHVTKRIEQLNEEYQSLEKRIQELEGLTTQHALSDIEFDLMRQLLTVFKDGIDEMTIEQKRAAIRTIVRKVIWDGVNAHVILFGVQDDEIEYPEIASVASDNTDDEDENDELVAFSDVDYEDDDTDDDRLGKTNPLSASKTHWGEDSKGYIDIGAVQFVKKEKKMKKPTIKLMKRLIVITAALLMIVVMSVPALATTSLEITSQPQNYVFPEGCVAYYEIEAEGEDLSPDSYHWYIVYEGKTYDTMNIKESDPWLHVAESCGRSNHGKGYFFNGIGPGLSGAEIYCVVTDGAKTVTSDKAIIQVGGTKMPPAVIKVPANITVPKDYGDGMLKIECKTDNAAKYSFQWYETSTGRLPEIMAIEYFDSVLPIHTDKVGTSYYVCMVTTPEGGRAYSSVIPVTIYEPKESQSGSVTPGTDTPKILTQPVDGSAKGGEKVTFSCKAEGKVKYQWWSSAKTPFNKEDPSAVSLSDGDGLSGTATDTLTITAGEPLGDKYYICEITGENGEKAYTDAAKLSVSDSEKKTDAAADKDGKKLSTGIIVLISCLAVALVGAVTTAIVLFVKMKKKSVRQ